MVERAEEVARYFRRKGTAESNTLAELLEDAVSYGRSVGADEKMSPPEELFDPNEALMRLIRAFETFPMPHRFNYSSLPLELAEYINKEVGSQIRDSVNLDSLCIPQQEKGINPRTRGVYNKAIIALSGLREITPKFPTLGDIRNASEADIMNVRNIGNTSLRFVLTAFRKPTETKR